MKNAFLFKFFIIALCLLYIIPNHASKNLEQRIVVVITSFNNKNWYEKNLLSVINQNYTNYIIVYIDDCSHDGTGLLVQQFIKDHNQEFRTILVLNQEWESQMANHYKAVHLFCADTDIVVHLDGDDLLYDETVLSKINEVYSTNDVWMTLGRPLYSTGGRWRPTPLEVMQYIQNTISYRQHGWSFTHLRTFKAWLFKCIKLQDLLYKGNFANISPAPDVAFSYPMLELSAYNHNMMLEDLLYIVNVKNPLSQCYIAPQEQIDIDKDIKFNWPHYQPLTHPETNISKKYSNKSADLIVLNEDLEELLGYLPEMVLSKGINKIIIPYNKHLTNTSLLNQLQAIPNLYLFPYDSEITTFSDLFSLIINNANDYIVLMSEYKNFSQFPISTAIEELERTQAYGFYFDKEIPKEVLNSKLYISLFEYLIAWQPTYTSHLFSKQDAIRSNLYRKTTVLEKNKKIKAKTLNEFKNQWAHLPIEDRVVCLTNAHI